MKKTVAILSLLFLFLFSGCAAGDIESLATATPSSTPTPTITPTSPPDPLLATLSASLLDGQQAEIEKKKADVAAIYAEVDRQNAAQAHGFRMTEQAFTATIAAASARDTKLAQPTKTPAPTTTPLPFQWTATVAISNAEIEKVEGDAQLTTLAVDRQTMKNWMDAYLPWTLLVAAVIVGAVLAYLGAQVHTLKRDRNGMLGAHIEKKGGNTVVVRPDLMKTPFATIADNGQVVEHGDPDDFQQQTTRRQQLVEAGRGRNMGEFNQVIKMLGGSTGAPTGGINYFDADRFFKGILQDAEDDFIDGEVSDAS